jgi:hypothetical protein
LKKVTESHGTGRQLQSIQADTIFFPLWDTGQHSKRASSRFILRELQLSRENKKKKKKKKKKSCLSPSLPARLLLYNYQRFPPLFFSPSECPGSAGLYRLGVLSFLIKDPAQAAIR